MYIHVISIGIIYTDLPMSVGMPAAWCIADREDTKVMELFMCALHGRCPSAGVTMIMIDDGKSGNT